MTLSSDLDSAIASLGRWGVIEVDGEISATVRNRRLPSLPSLWDQWLDTRWRRLPENRVRIYFNHSRSSPDFLVLAYAQAGPNTRPGTLRKALSILERIAKQKQLQAIVCHATHVKLSDRVMRYFGYERHAMHLRGKHFIRRLGR
jgi:hypothetical protein